MSISQPIADEYLASLLALNNEHAEELSFLDAAAFGRMSREAFHAACVDGDAFLLAFDQDARYESPNFLWFQQRYPRFVYIDRVVVASAGGAGGWLPRSTKTSSSALGRPGTSTSSAR